MSRTKKHNNLLSEDVLSSKSRIKSILISYYQGIRYRARYTETQDSFSVYRSTFTDKYGVKHKIEMHTICDGHGINGHLVSKYVTSSDEFSLPKEIVKAMNHRSKKYKKRDKKSDRIDFLSVNRAENICKQYVDKLFEPIVQENDDSAIDNNIFIDSGTTVVMVIAIDGSFRYILTIGDALAVWRSNGKIYRTHLIDPRDDIERLSKYLSEEDILYVIDANRVKYTDESTAESGQFMSLAVSRAIGDFRFNISAGIDHEDGYIIAPIPLLVDLDDYPPDNGYIVIASDSIDEASRMYSGQALSLLEWVLFQDRSQKTEDLKYKYLQYVYNACISSDYRPINTSMRSLSTDDTTIILLKESKVQNPYPNIDAADSYSDIFHDLKKGTKYTYNGVLITRKSLGKHKVTWKTIEAFIIIISHIRGGIDPLNYSPFLPVR